MVVVWYVLFVEVFGCWVEMGDFVVVYDGNENVVIWGYGWIVGKFWGWYWLFVDFVFEGGQRIGCGCVIGIVGLGIFGKQEQDGVKKVVSYLQ